MITLNGVICDYCGKKKTKNNPVMSYQDLKACEEGTSFAIYDYHTDCFKKAMENK